MSVPWKDIGTTILTLGLSWVAKKYAQRRAPKSLAEMIEKAKKSDVMPPALAKALKIAEETRFNAQLAELLQRAESLTKTTTKALREFSDPPPIPGEK